MGGVEIKTASFARDLGVDPVERKVVQTDSTGTKKRVAKGTQAEDWRSPMDTTAKNILFIGDSMLEGLAPRLAKYCDKNGHTLVEVIWYSSSTLYWGQSDRLAELIKKYKPNYIFVCLGANELYVPNIKHARRPYLKKMLAEIGDIPCQVPGPACR